MKNLKKIAALVIVLAMALSTVAFAFTDVAEDAGYYEAVEVMSGLGLLKGYEDGTFGPDKTITRAEFAAVVVRALGMEDAAAGAVATTMFTDVTSSHWAAGYVQVANQQGIIAGYGDGTFGPEDEVTYEQAVKMIVCALGYGIKFANVANAYPSAYLSQANTSGITVGAAGKIGEKATRATVAKLVYNALDVELMEQTGFGSEEKFETNGNTLLSSKLNMIKADAHVSALNFDPENADKVTIVFDKMNKIYAKAIDAVDSDGDVDLSALNDKDYEYASNVDLKKGYSCVAYLDVSEDDYVIKAMVPKAGKNSTLVLTGVQTKKTDATATEKAVTELSYYKNNVDVDISATKIRLEEALEIYVNKNADKFKDYDKFVDNWEKGLYQEITLIDNDNNNKYDIIYVSEYKDTFVVNKIVEKTNRISGKNNGSSKYVELDPEDEGYTFTIKDVNGNDVAFADIKVGDVLNVFESKSGNYTLKEVIVSNETVEGTITEYNSVTDKYTIGDKEYSSVKAFEVGTTGKFTVDMYGNIIEHVIDASNRKFGLLYTIYNETSGVDDEVTAMILTAEGKFESYAFAKTVNYNNVKKDKTAQAGLVNTLKDGKVDETKIALVAYTLNSANEITKLNDDSTFKTLDTEYAVINKVFNEKDEVVPAEYDGAAEEIAGAYVVDSSIIITNKKDEYKANDRANDYAVASKSYFVDEEEYVIEAFTDGDEILIATIFGATAKVDGSSMPMYVTSVSETTDSNGDKATKVKGYVDGDLVSIVIPDDVDGDKGENVKVGSMIQYTGDAEVSVLKILVSDAQIVEVEKFTDIISTKGAKDDYFAIAGKVDRIVNNKFYIKDKDDLNFDTGINAMFVTLKKGKDGSKSIDKVYADQFTAGDVETKELMEKDSDDYIILYKYDNKELGAIIVDVNGDTEI